MKKQITNAGLIAALTVLAAFSPMPATVVETNEPNVTVIYKTNPNWPVRGMMTQDPCAVRTCEAI